MTPSAFRLEIAPSAERSLRRLPASVAVAVVEFLLGAVVENPRRVGHPLRRELQGLWSARRGAYRIVYEIDDVSGTVTILRIDHRADVYRGR